MRMIFRIAITTREKVPSKGFTLLELSIVLVVISLIVGGVMAGQSLIASSQLRVIYTKAQGYITAVSNFNDKYGYLPGDFPTATAVWGAEANCPNQASTTMLTCNGDGNHHIGDYNNSNTAYEYFRAWQQLANAGMVEGHYTGIGYNNPNGYTAANAQPGVNVPVGNSEAAGYSFFYLDNSFPRHFNNISNGGNYFFYGASQLSQNAYGGPTDGAILSAAQAWTIDRKIDDGSPASGKITTYDDHSACVTNNNASTAAYNTSSTVSKACQLIFGTDF